MTNLWKNVGRDDVIKAIKEFERLTQAYVKSKNTFLLFKGRRYPAKHIRGLAFKIANSKWISKSDYSGGLETVNFFKKLGFDVEYKKKYVDKVSQLPIKRVFSKKLSVVDQKNSLQIILQKAYGIIETEKKFEWLKTPDPKKLPAEYKKIVKALEKYRNHNRFLKPNRRPQCDIVIEKYKIIVEYDEDQHFSHARKIALENYPKNVKTYFSKNYWIEQCNKLSRRDNDPVDRDEIRAYYDSVRDIEAIKHGYKLIRIKHGDYDWNNKNAIEHFKKIVSNKSHNKKAIPGIITSHKIARIIVSDEQYREDELILAKLKNTLVSFINEVYPSTKFEFIVTPGGFLEFKWPLEFTRWIDSDNANSDKNLKIFHRNAELKIKELFNSLGKVALDKLKDTANYFTIGIDSANPHNDQSMELVAVFDLKSQKVINWTGKFYPTISEETDLIRIINLNSHFVKLNDQKIVILGCHDLNAFSPRGQAVANPKGWRKKLANKFKKLCHDFQPSVIIQHPHFTDTPNIWNLSWITLGKALPCVKHFVSGIKFSNKDGDRPRAKLNKVLEKTKKGDVVDYIYV